MLFLCFGGYRSHLSGLVSMSSPMSSVFVLRDSIKPKNHITVTYCATIHNIHEHTISFPLSQVQFYLCPAFNAEGIHYHLSPKKVIYRMIIKSYCLVFGQPTDIIHETYLLLSTTLNRVFFPQLIMLTRREAPINNN